MRFLCPSNNLYAPLDLFHIHLEDYHLSFIFYLFISLFQLVYIYFNINYFLIMLLFCLYIINTDIIVMIISYLQ